MAGKLVSGKVSEYRKLSRFSSLKAFNSTIELFLSQHKADFSKGELIGFKRLVRYAAKYPGVAFCKIATLVSATTNTLSGISRSTFERMVRKAKKLGILDVIKTERNRGGDGHNVYLFRKFEVAISDKLKGRKDVDKRYWTSLDASFSESQTNDLKTNNLSKKNIRTVREIFNDKVVSKLDKSFVSSFVPKEFANLVGCFYNDKDAIEEFWRVVKGNTAKLNYDKETLLHTATYAFRQLIAKVKKGNIDNPFGFFNGILRRQLQRLHIETIKDELSESDDWLPLPTLNV